MWETLELDALNVCTISNEWTESFYISFELPASCFMEIKKLFPNLITMLLHEETKVLTHFYVTAYNVRTAQKYIGNFSNSFRNLAFGVGKKSLEKAVCGWRRWKPYEA